MNTEILDKTEKKRLATRERVRKYRERKRQGLTVTTNKDGFTLEAVKTDVTLTLPPAEGVITKAPLTLRTLFVGGHWLKILS